MKALMMEMSKANINMLIQLNQLLPEENRDNFDKEYIEQIVPIINKLVKKHSEQIDKKGELNA